MQPFSRRSFIRALASLVLAAPLWPAIARSATLRRFVMQGQSMAPTLRDHQALRIDTSAYRRRGPQRGDIVLFLGMTIGQPDRLFVKRVIGLPGEVVAVHGGNVYINGRRLRERWPHSAASYVYPPHRIPNRTYFVLGDNRNNSFDSHLWSSLGLPARDINGKVLLPAHTDLTDPISSPARQS